MGNQASYRELSDELDEILASLQNNELDIDQATKLYEQGTKITTKLQQYLKSAENKVTKIKGDTGAQS